MLLSACNSEDGLDNPIQKPQLKKVTIKCSVGKDNPKTKASISIGKKTEDGEGFIWEAGDSFYAYSINTTFNMMGPTPSEFNITSGVGSKNGEFTATGYPIGSKQVMASIYGESLKDPNMLSLVDYVQAAKEYSFRFNMPSNSAVQDGRNINNLSKGIHMCSFNKIEDKQMPDIKFKHLTSLFRFTITNSNTTSIKVQQVDIECAKRFANLNAEVRYNIDSEKMTFIPSGEYGLFLEMKNVILAPGETCNSFLPFIPGMDDMSGNELKFKLEVSDQDGSNLRTYESKTLSTDLIIAKNGVNHFELGKRYWFNLSLNDAVKVNNISVSDWSATVRNLANIRDIQITPLDADSADAAIFVDYENSAYSDISSYMLGKINNWELGKAWENKDDKAVISVVSPYRHVSLFKLKVSDGVDDVSFKMLNNDRSKSISSLLDSDGKINFGVLDHLQNKVNISIKINGIDYSSSTLKVFRHNSLEIDLRTGVQNLDDYDIGDFNVNKEASGNYICYMVPQIIKSGENFIQILYNGIRYNYKLSTDYEFVANRENTLNLELAITKNKSSEGSEMTVVKEEWNTNTRK